MAENTILPYTRLFC